jgi:hypothetical protein
MLVAPLRHPVIRLARLPLASLRALGLVSPRLAEQTLGRDQIAGSVLQLAVRAVYVLGLTAILA